MSSEKSRLTFPLSRAVLHAKLALRGQREDLKPHIQHYYFNPQVNDRNRPPLERRIVVLSRMLKEAFPNSPLHVLDAGSEHVVFTVEKDQEHQHSYVYRWLCHPLITHITTRADSRLPFSWQEYETHIRELADHIEAVQVDLGGFFGEDTVIKQTPHLLMAHLSQEQLKDLVFAWEGRRDVRPLPIPSEGIPLLVTRQPIWSPLYRDLAVWAPEPSQPLLNNAFSGNRAKNLEKSFTLITERNELNDLEIGVLDAAFNNELLNLKRRVASFGYETAFPRILKQFGDFIKSTGIILDFVGTNNMFLTTSESSFEIHPVFRDPVVWGMMNLQELDKILKSVQEKGAFPSSCDHVNRVNALSAFESLLGFRALCLYFKTEPPVFPTVAKTSIGQWRKAFHAGR